MDTALDDRPRCVLGEEIRPVLRGTLFELHAVTGPVDSGPPPHNHPWDEGYLVLDGALGVTLDGAPETVLGAGASVLVPAGATHSYRIAAPGTRFLTCTSGDGAGRFFDDMDASTPHRVPAPEDMPAIVEVARRNGLDSPLFG
ncbi:cupin domain-containing protein [Pseudonocardia sp.]|uniref:cupin domain-containing protein n=1 Tax=Pseudonocardia sp. TaxID=60912 RepID=UPI003D09AFD1